MLDYVIDLQNLGYGTFCLDDAMIVELFPFYVWLYIWFVVYSLKEQEVTIVQNDFNLI